LQDLTEHQLMRAARSHWTIRKVYVLRNGVYFPLLLRQGRV